MQVVSALISLVTLVLVFFATRKLLQKKAGEQTKDIVEEKKEITVALMQKNAESEALKNIEGR